MPLIPDDWDRWLDPTTTIEELRTILKAALGAYLADVKAGLYPPRVPNSGNSIAISNHARIGRSGAGNSLLARLRLPHFNH